MGGPDGRARRRVSGGGGRRSRERLLLRTGRSRRPIPARRERPRSRRGQSPVPPTDGLRRRDDDHPQLRAGPGTAVPLVAGGTRSRTSNSCSGCASTLTPCAIPTPITIRTAKPSSSATSRPREEDATCPGEWSSPACRTTSWPTRPPMPSSMGSTGGSWSPPTSTAWPSTRPSRISSRCFSTSPSRRPCATRSGRRGATWRARACWDSSPSSSARPSANTARCATPWERWTRSPISGIQGAQSGGSRHPPRAPLPRLHPGGGGVRHLPLDLQVTHRGPAAHRHRRHRRAPPGGTSCRIWWTAWRGRRPPPRGTSSTCASAPSITARRWTSVSATTCGRWSPPTATSCPTTNRSYRIAVVEAFRRRGIYPQGCAQPVGGEPLLAPAGRRRGAGAAGAPAGHRRLCAAPPGLTAGRSRETAGRSARIWS